MKLTPRNATLALGLAALGLTAVSATQAQTLTNRYSFNDTGSTVVDSVGGVNGTLMNGATIANGSLVTNGTGGGQGDQYVSLGTSFALPTGSFSIEDFFTPAATNGGYATIYSFADDQATYILGTENRAGDNSAGIDFSLNNGQGVGNQDRVPGSIAEVPGKSTDFLVTYDGTTISSYVNGVLSATSTYTATQPRTYGPFDGIAGGGPYPDPGLNGTTQDFRVFSGALTAAQAVADFNAGPDSVATGAPVPEASTTISFGILLMLGLGGLVLNARKRSAARLS